jgi:hypothetical protein
VTFREWVHGPECERFDPQAHPEARAAAILGVSRQSIRNWLRNGSPARTKWMLLSARTGWTVPPEGFGPGEVAR